jgi:hypothetical protein
LVFHYSYYYYYRYFISRHSASRWAMIDLQFLST